MSIDALLSEIKERDNACVCLNHEAMLCPLHRQRQEGLNAALADREKLLAALRHEMETSHALAYTGKTKEGRHSLYTDRRAELLRILAP